MIAYPSGPAAGGVALGAGRTLHCFQVSLPDPAAPWSFRLAWWESEDAVWRYRERVISSDEVNRLSLCGCALDRCAQIFDARQR